MTPTAKLDALTCSFCNKDQSEVAELVAGPGVYICNECIDLCNQIIALVVDHKKTGASKATRSSRSRVPPLIKAWDGLPDEDLLSEMVRAHAAHQNVDRAVAHHVAALRERGVSWAQIGEGLGMARQSAWERFSGEDLREDSEPEATVSGVSVGADGHTVRRASVGERRAARMDG